MKNPVFITGMGLVTPLKPFEGLNSFWDALCSGEDAVKRMAPPMLDVGREWLMASVDLSSLPEFVSPENKLKIIAKTALEMALEDAGLGAIGDGYKESPVGLITGTVLGNVLFKEKRSVVCSWPLLSDQSQQEGDIPGDSLSFIGSHLAAKYAFLRPYITVSTACASGTDAIGIAARQIALGRCDIIIAGGVDVLSDFALIGFHVLQAMTEDKIRPFDKKRTGLALGEGAAFVVLESEKHAIRRGAKIYGRIMGYASRSDAHHLTGPHKEGRGLAAAVSWAMAEASLLPDKIGYVNAHGTGTVYNDLMETKVIKRVFGKRAFDVPISSTKSMLGHAFGAAGAVEAICCLLAVLNNIVPPTINFAERDPECDLDYVPNRARECIVKTAISLSAGFGGQNSALIVGET